VLQATYPILIFMISSISHRGYVTNLHLVIKLARELQLKCYTSYTN
jgi:hypothetical protein